MRRIMMFTIGLAWALLFGALVDTFQASWEGLAASETPQMLYLPIICKPEVCGVEGEIISLLAGEVCCPGLDTIENAYPVETGCESVLDSAICAYCGDMICGLGENLCNCPEDCE